MSEGGKPKGSKQKQPKSAMCNKCPREIDLSINKLHYLGTVNFKQIVSNKVSVQKHRLLGQSGGQMIPLKTNSPAANISTRDSNIKVE